MRLQWLAIALLVCGMACPPLAAEVPQNSAFNAHSFAAIDGGTSDLDAFRGQVIVLNLWAVWCAPCIAEIPHLVALQRDLEPGKATVVGIALDSGSARAIRSFWVDRLEIEPNYPLWKGSVEDARTLFGARTFPTTLIIDRHGQVRTTLLGAQTQSDLMEALRPWLQPH